MAWAVEAIDAFAEWLGNLPEDSRVEILAHIAVLEEIGPGLTRPRADTLKHTNLKNLRELRIQIKGSPWRVLYAFDPRRVAVLLVGGCKEGDDRWYPKHIPIAERLYAEHLAALNK